MKSSCSSNTIVTIHLDEVEKIDKPLGTIMEELVTAHSVPLDKQVGQNPFIFLQRSYQNCVLRFCCSLTLDLHTALAPSRVD